MNATMPTGPHDHRAGEPTETHRHLGPVGTVAGAALHAARRSAGASESALAAEPGVVRVAVVDLGGPTEPRVVPFGEAGGTARENGRGLYTVACLAKQWDWELTGGGRRVWAELADHAPL